MDKYHQENVSELEIILNDYKHENISKEDLMYYLKCMIFDLSIQIKEDNCETINKTFNYIKEKFSKREFYKHIERLFVGNGEDMLNTGLLRNNILTITIKISDILIKKISFDGEIGDIIIDQDRYYPFKENGEFSTSEIRKILSIIKNNVKNDTSIKIDSGGFKYIDNNDYNYFIENMFKYWCLFLIEECSIKKENITLHMTSDEDDKYINYIISLI